MEQFWETWKRRGQDESDTGGKNKVGGLLRRGWFSSRKLEQDREFRSEGLQEENNERETRERWYNQLIIQNRQMQTQQSHAIQALQQG